MTGSIAGAVAGMLLAGPPGAVGGAVAGPILASVLREMTHRILSHREDARVGGAFRAATARLQERLEAGDEVRDDGFFASKPGRRSDAEEIIEGVLLAVQRGHEERKVEFLGYLLANLCFESEVDAYLANWTIRTAQELTWAQFVLLSALGRTERPTLPVVEIGTGAAGWRTWGIHEQLSSRVRAPRDDPCQGRRDAPVRSQDAEHTPCRAGVVDGWHFAVPTDVARANSSSGRDGSLGSAADARVRREATGRSLTRRVSVGGRKPAPTTHLREMYAVLDGSSGTAAHLAVRSYFCIDQASCR